MSSSSRSKEAEKTSGVTHKRKREDPSSSSNVDKKDKTAVKKKKTTTTANKVSLETKQKKGKEAKETKKKKKRKTETTTPTKDKATVKSKAKVEDEIRDVLDDDSRTTTPKTTASSRSKHVIMVEELVSEINKTRKSGEDDATKKHVLNTIRLLESENTIPFITRYRKELTGGMNENDVLAIKHHIEYAAKVQRSSSFAFRHRLL